MSKRLMTPGGFRSVYVAYLRQINGGGTEGAYNYAVYKVEVDREGKVVYSRSFSNVDKAEGVFLELDYTDVAPSLK